jgi:hypothetical protein
MYTSGKRRGLIYMYIWYFMLDVNAQFIYISYSDEVCKLISKGNAQLIDYIRIFEREKSNLRCLINVREVAASIKSSHWILELKFYYHVNCLMIHIMVS